ncbi:MAG: hypothetical protein IJI36_05245, partial [Kiritimatiellae bacterium]|nr:hypothetical protein [Kiritimatiellia bacterium]
VTGTVACGAGIAGEGWAGASACMGVRAAWTGTASCPTGSPAGGMDAGWTDAAAARGTGSCAGAAATGTVACGAGIAGEVWAGAVGTDRPDVSAGIGTWAAWTGTPWLLDGSVATCGTKMTEEEKFDSASVIGAAPGPEGMRECGFCEGAAVGTVSCVWLMIIGF